MKVLHLISSGGMYGAEAVILNLSRTLNRQGHESSLGIFSNSSNPNTQLHEVALLEGIPSQLISCRGQIDKAVPASIRELASKMGSQIVHAHGYKADVYAYLAMKSAATPLVSTCHNWLDDGRAVQLYGIIDRQVLRRYQSVIAVSEDVRQRLLSSSVPSARVHLIRNGLDLLPFEHPVPSLPETASLRVGWVGRLSPEKGPDIFLRAAALVHQLLPTTRFALIGDGPGRADLENLASSLDLTSNVDMLGRRTDMPGLYASFDVMVSSSHREGLPMAILEGMASGLPWVASAVGDVPTIIRNDETGLLVPPGDPKRLAEALISVLRSKDDRKRLGRAARALVESEFSSERMSAEYLDVYNDAANLRSGKGEAGLRHTVSRGSH